jgi:hypothetical protein
MSAPKHPGTIEMVDEDADTRRSVEAASAPETVAFVDGTPVVRIVKSTRGEEIFIRSYGVDGALLSTTVGRAGR